MGANARWQRVAIAAAIVAAALFARCHWDRLAAPQTPPKLFDSNVYLEIAARPLGLDLLYYTKPPTVPLIYRAVDRDPAAIVDVQRELAFAAWAALTAAVVVALRRRAARLVAVAVAVGFVLAAPRVGWTGVILSESINDTLMAAVAACAIGLAIATRRGPRIALALALAGLGLAWLFTRDTNAIAAVVALVIAGVIWPIRRWWTAHRGGLAIAGLTVAASAVLLASARVVPEPLPFQATWYVPLTSRAAYPMVNNLVTRVMRDDRGWLAERGAPVAALAVFADPEPRPDKAVQRVPEAEPAKRWMVEHGDATYLRWLVRHPIDRIVELVGARWIVLSERHSARMPVGWAAHDNAHLEVELWRRLTTNRWILLALVLASPLLLRRPRGHPLAGVALCLIGSGVIAAAASYYGDAIELARHCYGAGQQIVLGLFIALCAWLDGVRWRAPGRRAPVDAPASLDAA